MPKKFLLCPKVRWRQQKSAKAFFIISLPNESQISFIPVFWYFIKEITLYDVEYSLNFHKNA